jgi:hypothetical protein
VASLGVQRRFLFRKRRGAAKFADGAQHPQAVSQGDADVSQELIGQLRNSVSFDPVFAKCGFVPVEAEAAQPGPDIHQGQSPSRAAPMMGRGRRPVQNRQVSAVTGQDDARAKDVPKDAAPVDTSRLGKDVGQISGTSSSLPKASKACAEPVAGFLPEALAQRTLTNAAQAAARPAPVRT